MIELDPIWVSSPQKLGKPKPKTFYGPNGGMGQAQNAK